MTTTDEARKMATTQFRKRPVVIEAFCLGVDPIPDWFMDRVSDDTIRIMNLSHGNGYCKIQTLEGSMRGDHGDYIIRGVKGEIYPCKPDIFAATYEAAALPTPSRADEAAAREWFESGGEDRRALGVSCGEANIHSLANLLSRRSAPVQESDGVDPQMAYELFEDGPDRWVLTQNYDEDHAPVFKTIQEAFDFCARDEMKFSLKVLGPAPMSQFMGHARTTTAGCIEVCERCRRSLNDFRYIGCLYKPGQLPAPCPLSAPGFASPTATMARTALSAMSATPVPASVSDVERATDWLVNNLVIYTGFKMDQSRIDSLAQALRDHEAAVVERCAGIAMQPVTFDDAREYRYENLQARIAAAIRATSPTGEE